MPTPLSTAAVGIICKTPRPGFSKTRLVPLLGEAAAADLAGVFLQDTAAGIESVPSAIGCRGYAVFAPEGSEQRLSGYMPPSFGLVCRTSTNLGLVLTDATRHFLDHGHDIAVLVNGDSPTLPPTLIADAIIAARQPGERVVLGPASDGGYYLIAMKRLRARLFQDITWSTDAVTRQTCERAAEIGLEVCMLPQWYDVDDLSSFRTLIGELAGKGLPFDTQGLAPNPARHTRAFIAGHAPALREFALT